MPCRDAHIDTHYGESRIKELQKTVTLQQAAICAVCNELQRRAILDDVLHNAAVNGGIDIKPMWEEHIRVDTERLRAELDKYSKDEIRMIKKLLNKSA